MPGGRHLDDAGNQAVGAHLDRRRQLQGRTCQPIAAAIAVGRDLPLGRPERLMHVLRKEVVLAGSQHTDPKSFVGSLGAAVCGSRRLAESRPAPATDAGRAGIARKRLQNVALVQEAASQAAELAAQMRAARS